MQDHTAPESIGGLEKCPSFVAKYLSVVVKNGCADVQLTKSSEPYRNSRTPESCCAVLLAGNAPGTMNSSKHIAGGPIAQAKPVPLLMPLFTTAISLRNHMSGALVPGQAMQTVGPQMVPQR